MNPINDSISHEKVDEILDAHNISIEHREKFIDSLHTVYDLMRTSNENGKMANKREVEKAAGSLEKALSYVNNHGFRDWVAFSICSEFEENPIWSKKLEETKKEISECVQSLNRLHEMVSRSVAGNFNIPTGSRTDMGFYFSVEELLAFWREDLGREVTVTLYGPDGLPNKPSQTVRFVYDCIVKIDPSIGENSVYHLLQSLK